jgi:nucleotide-binding universal stress UspA family protein
MVRASPLSVTDLHLDGGVVVGDDGSEAAGAAISYGLEEAKRRDSVLHVVRAWTIPDAERPPDAPFGYVPSLHELEVATLEVTRQRVRRLMGDSGHPPVEVHVVHGPAVDVLVAASRMADVVIVGSRGLGGLASLVLGSVADQVIRRSSGPVIVVR